ncbi:uncharacterized protein EV422DRAFT_537410 [Fimicolochytrium jonesii]|uniref:uncharacterized protein n=1 Tax=Fimicolochytrium jonesii TaxID=1396493 RepID=UPI0022FEBECD|nr:uncharacterized protein EV422DRAFT_537410 [Fimicolochytrium jonesii]KAI8818536.1 hypothetical protein EV422DRAFT_537410 [Fimicolochytrium jonesii]
MWSLRGQPIQTPTTAESFIRELDHDEDLESFVHREEQEITLAAGGSFDLLPQGEPTNLDDDPFSTSFDHFAPAMGARMDCYMGMDMEPGVDNWTGHPHDSMQHLGDVGGQEAIDLDQYADIADISHPQMAQANVAYANVAHASVAHGSMSAEQIPTRQIPEAMQHGHHHSHPQTVRDITPTLEDAAIDDFAMRLDDSGANGAVNGVEEEDYEDNGEGFAVTEVPSSPTPSATTHIPAPSSGTALYYDPALLSHRNLFCNQADADDYPETPERVHNAYETLKTHGLVDRCVRLAARSATSHELRRVHTEGHIEEINKTRTMDLVRLKDMSERRYNDVFFSSETADVARLSCGGAIAAAEAVWTGKVRNAVALIRPPGHHAESTKAMGFCIYNNVAVAAKALQSAHGAQRIMILDWDVHHGNGTQKVFYNDPNVLYVSLHRFDDGKFFPYLTIGGMDYVGGKGAEGKNVNIPWPCEGMADADYIHAFHRVVMPIAYEFNPQIVLVSAGFDAAAGDPLGNCGVTPAGYAQMTLMLSGLAGGKVVMCLEGGYHVDAVASSVVAVTRALLGDGVPCVDVARGPGEVAVETVQRVTEVQSLYWRCLRPVFENTKVKAAAYELQRRMVSLPDILNGYREHYLSTKHGLIHHTIKNDPLADRFNGQIHLSPNLSSHTGLLFIFIHPSFDETKGRLSAHTNTLKITETYVYDPTTQYIDSIISGGHAFIDVQPGIGGDVDETALIVKEVAKYVWDKHGRTSPARRVILLGVNEGAGALLNLVALRPDLQKRTLSIVSLIAAGTPPPMHSSCAEWYFNNSRVYTWSEDKLGAPIKTEMTEMKRGKCFSAGPQPPTPTSSILLDMLHLRVFSYLARTLGVVYAAQLAAKPLGESITIDDSNETGRSVGDQRKGKDAATVPQRVSRPTAGGVSLPLPPSSSSSSSRPHQQQTMQSTTPKPRKRARSETPTPPPELIDVFDEPLSPEPAPRSAPVSKHTPASSTSRSAGLGTRVKMASEKGFPPRRPKGTEVVVEIRSASPAGRRDGGAGE